MPDTRDARFAAARADGDRRLGVDVSRYVARSATGVVFILAPTVGLGASPHALLPAWVGAISLVYAAYEIAESLTRFGHRGTFAPGETVDVIGTPGFVARAIVVGVGLAQRGKEPAPAAPA